MIWPLGHRGAAARVSSRCARPVSRTGAFPPPARRPDADRARPHRGTAAPPDRESRQGSGHRYASTRPRPNPVHPDGVVTGIGQRHPPQGGTRRPQRAAPTPHEDVGARRVRYTAGRGARQQTLIWESDATASTVPDRPTARVPYTFLFATTAISQSCWANPLIKA